MIDNNRNIAIIHEHYHVTDAGMRLLLEALSSGVARYFTGATQYLWYSPKKFQNRSNPHERFSQKTTVLMEDHALGYLSQSYASVEAFEAAIEKRKQSKIKTLKAKIKEHKTVVHVIQNPTLLKNPVETQANARLAAELLDQEYLQVWYLHDFMEDSRGRQPLRDYIKTIAGPKTEKIYGRDGCGIAWTTSPNIFYAMINQKDVSAIRGFLPDHMENNAFYLPDPVDVDTIRVPSIFERDSATLDDRIISYCESNAGLGFSYDPAADLLLATEFARERKNTGEQLLILNILNTLAGAQGTKFQLLVTLLPTMGNDAKRMKIFQEYIRLNKLPVAMGFGSRIIGRGDDLKKGQFTMTDLWGHPRARAVISTSVKEGFGLNFINPSIATYDNPYTLSTVGRRLRDIFPDFQKLGMAMDSDAFYDSIVIDPSVLIADNTIFDRQKRHILKHRLASRYKTISYEGVIPLGRDFADYGADEQVLLMDLVDYHKLSERLSGFIEFITDKAQMNRIAKENAMAIMAHLSLESYIEKFKKMIETAFDLKCRRLGRDEHPKMIFDNTSLTNFFNPTMRSTYVKDM